MTRKMREVLLITDEEHTQVLSSLNLTEEAVEAWLSRLPSKMQSLLSIPVQRTEGWWSSG